MCVGGEWSAGVMWWLMWRCLLSGRPCALSLWLPGIPPDTNGQPGGAPPANLRNSLSWDRDNMDRTQGYAGDTVQAYTRLSLSLAGHTWRSYHRCHSTGNRHLFYGWLILEHIKGFDGDNDLSSLVTPEVVMMTASGSSSAANDDKVVTLMTFQFQWMLGIPLYDLTLNVRGPSYVDLTRSISWLLKPWLLRSPGHQQPWYWLCRIGRFLSYLRKDFNYLHRINVEKWHKM